jgi:translation initiation factor IF-1
MRGGILYVTLIYKMTKKQVEKKEATVLKHLPNTMFRVELDNGDEAIATLKGKLRRSYVRVLPGDRVLVEFTPYDDKRGRIVKKFKKKNKK